MHMQVAGRAKARRKGEFNLKRNNVLKEKLTESFKSVLPVTILVFVIAFFIVPVPNSALVAFEVGSVLLIVGMALFTLGVDVAITPIGQYVGQTVTKSRKLWIIGFAGFLVGILITVSEPDLQVLAGQVPSVRNIVLILAVAVGVGLFLAVALLRILFRINMRLLLLGFYVVVFALSRAVPKEFLSVAFDSGGVTTGPMTVPFILALGVGLSSIRSDVNSENDCFGLVALCSIGPILAVMLLGVFYKPDGGVYVSEAIELADTSLEVSKAFLGEMTEYLKEVALGLAPVAVMFAVMRVFLLKMSFRAVVKIIVGLVYTYIGLVLFLLGANAGFMPVGNYVGKMLGLLENNWILVIVGMLVGYFMVAAEPAVYVLSHQVYEITAGAISKRALSLSMSIGVSVSVGLTMLRILLDIDILALLLPGYIVAFALMPFTPAIFTSIAFDSGGVASGAMTATFLMPMCMGACEAVGAQSGEFGAVAMVAMTPLITIQVLGILSRLKSPAPELAAKEPDDIIEL